MHSQNMTNYLSPARTPGQKLKKPPALCRHTHRGVTLIELMVGIVLGLLIVAVAMGALIVSRGVSGTVSDASNIQQQASYAMRVIGQQLRQAGSLRLNLDPGIVTTPAPYMAPVAFETTVAPFAGTMESFKPATHTLSGTASPVGLTTGFRRFTEAVLTSASAQTISRNCRGGPDESSTDGRVESIFQLNGNELRCSGNGAASQAVVQNVANFQVRYLLQDTTTSPGIPTIKSVDATGVGANWGQVQGVEVCLVIYGSEPIDMNTGSNYTDCDGSAVDMSTLTGARARRMHIAFRNVFQLRSQGLIGSVL